jgi:hypothetical protein
MPVQDVRHVKDGRPPGRARVRDRKHGLQEPIEIGGGHGAPLERQRLVAFVPPAVRHAGRKEASLSRSAGHGPAAHARRQDAALDCPLLTLSHVNMERRPDAVRGNATVELQDDLTSLSHATKTQGLPRMTILEPKVRVHHIRDAARRASEDDGWF